MTMKGADESILMEEVTNVSELGKLIRIQIEVDANPEGLIQISSKKRTDYFYNSDDIQYMKVEY